MKKKTFVFLAVLSIVLFAQMSYAGYSYNWTGNAGDGLWSTAANWDHGVPNTTARYLFIYNGTVSASNVDTELDYHFYLGGNTGRSGDSASLTLESGTINVAAGHFFVGHTSGNSGSLTVNGGTINAAGSVGLAIGHGGTGYFEINGGTVDTAQYIRTSSMSNSDGASQFIVNGGTVKTLRFYAGSSTNNASDSIVVSGGLMNITNLFRLGEAGSATLTLSNTGTITVKNAFTIGQQSTASGILNVSGGSLTCGSLIIGADGSGEVNLTGGSITAGTLTMNSTAILDIAGGEMILDGNITDITSYGNVLAYSGNGSFVYDYDSVEDITTITAIPEPATIAILSIGSLLAIRRKRF